MTKILTIVPFPMSEDDITRRSRQRDVVKLDAGTEITFRPVRVSSESFMSQHDWILMDLGVCAAGQSAQQEGFDAVCVDTMSDSGVAALRSILTIPVLGPGRASMLYALSLGSTFSVLTQWQPANLRYRKVLRELGLERQCASVRSFDIPPDFHSLLSGKEDKAFPLMLDTARRCVEEDGAEVICLGSTTMHEAHAYLAERLPVPVINPGPLSYKLIESMLALGLTHSARAYSPPVMPKPDLMAALVAGEE